MPAVLKRCSSIHAAVSAERAARSTHGFSWSRALAKVAGGHERLDGYEGEVYSELAKVSGVLAGAGRMPMPVELLADPYIRPDVLARNMVTGISAAGGALVGTATAPILEILKPWSITASAGITAIQAAAQGFGLSDIDVPSLDSNSVAYWQSTEDAEMDKSDPTIGKAALSPKSAYVFTRLSRLLAKQTDVTDTLLQRQALSAIGALIDRTIIIGTGTNGQPRGIANTALAVVKSGAFNYGHALDMEAGASLYGATDDAVRFVASVDVRKLLKAREAGVGGVIGPIWSSDPSGDKVAGRRANVSTFVPAASIVAGPWSDCIFATWGVPVLELNPWGRHWDGGAAFRKGEIEARVIVDCDVAFQNPNAWTYHSAIA